MTMHTSTLNLRIDIRHRDPIPRAEDIAAEVEAYIEISLGERSPVEAEARVQSAFIALTIAELTERIAREIDAEAHPDSEWARERREGLR